jgi:transposase
LTAEPSCKDEARIGQKNKITRRWARRATRPTAPHDQRTRSAYIFGAICPARGIAAGLVLPFWNTEAMALHLAEISQAVTPGAHAVLLLDQAGWHLSGKLDLPGNITLMPLPPKSPELNPVENIWQYVRENWLSNRIFQSYDDILDHCCHAWSKLTNQPWTIMSIGLRDWLMGANHRELVLRGRGRS